MWDFLRIGRGNSTASLLGNGPPARHELETECGDRGQAPGSHRLTQELRIAMGIMHFRSIERRRTVRAALSVDFTARRGGSMPNMMRMAVLGFAVLVTERKLCPCSRFGDAVHKKVRELPCQQGRKRAHGCDIEDGGA
jgi:hypothetical protein